MVCNVLKNVSCIHFLSKNNVLNVDSLKYSLHMSNEKFTTLKITIIKISIIGKKLWKIR